MPSPNAGPRLAIPRRLKERLPFIHDALICLRQARHVEWIGPKRGEARFHPFLKDFDPSTRTTIERLATLHGVSRSRVISTALELHASSAAVPAGPRGYRTGSHVGFSANGK